MSKYSVGDKFVIEIGEVFSGNTSIKDNKLYRVKSFRSLVFDKTGLDNLERLEGDSQGILSMDEHNCKVNETYIRAYGKGLQDAWELARRIVLKAENGGLNYDDFKKAFGVGDYYRVLKTLTPQEALAKLQAYEKEQAEIKVGDVVYANDEPCCYGVVTWVDKNMGLIHIMWGDGSCGNECKLSEIHKTGKHINIESLLEQIYE